MISARLCGHFQCIAASDACYGDSEYPESAPHAIGVPSTMGDVPTPPADADAIRSAEREAILRLARGIAGQAARAAGYRDAADVSVDFVTMVLNEAFAARDAELGQPPTDASA